MSDASTIIAPTTQQKAGPAPAAVSGTATVYVGLKLPNGLILRAFDMVASGEVTQHGYKEIKIAREKDQRFPLHGNARDVRAVLANQDDGRLIVNGFAITEGCPRDLWDSWFAANKDTPLVRNHLIFSANSDSDARAKAREFAGQKSGLEPIDPNRPNERTGMRGIEQGVRV